MCKDELLGPTHLRFLGCRWYVGNLRAARRTSPPNRLHDRRRTREEPVQQIQADDRQHVGHQVEQETRRKRERQDRSDGIEAGLCRGYFGSSTSKVGCLMIFGGRDGVNGPVTRTAGDSATVILVARNGRGWERA
jgi:hypothetical protein